MAPTQIPALQGTASQDSHIEVTIEVTQTSTYYPSTPSPTLCPRNSLPPPYTSPSEPHLRMTSLSFFPRPTSAPAPDELPGYRATPRTIAERCFYWGMMCPFVWLLGALKLRYPERIVGPGKHAPAPGGGSGSGSGSGEEDLELGLPSDATSGNLAMTLLLWEEEERVWALRCAWSFSGFVVIAGLLTVALYESFS